MLTANDPRRARYGVSELLAAGLGGPSDGVSTNRSTWVPNRDPRSEEMSELLAVWPDAKVAQRHNSLGVLFGHGISQSQCVERILS